jgi:dihydrofolate synthase/folylpolyglutamate synthase
VLDSYNDAVSWLFEQFPSYQQIGAAAYKPDLSNAIQLLELVGNPHKKLKFIHIAGTNGKGTTSSLISSVFTENKYKTGLFTSPHILDFRERIRINGEMISEKSVVEFCTAIQSIQGFEPSFFEISFVMALTHFANNQCDYCIIEVGMGGRLDATNCISPLVSVITTIGLDHTQFLGTTLEAIAGEKAGIIKQNIPVVIGEKRKETEFVFRFTAKQKHVPIYFSDELDYPNWFENLPFPFNSGFQLNNAKTAFTTLVELAKKEKIIFNEAIFTRSVKNLSANTGYQKRLEVVSTKPRIILDVSHNFEGIQATLSLVKVSTENNLHLIYGSSSDKNYDQIIQLFSREKAIFLTPFSSERSLKQAELEEIKENFVDSNMEVCSTVNEAIKQSLLTLGTSDTLLIFGSFFLIQDIQFDFSKINYNSI